MFCDPTQVLRKSLQGGIALSTGSFLVYEAHRLISGLAEVHASFKGNVLKFWNMHIPVLSLKSYSYRAI